MPSLPGKITVLIMACALPACAPGGAQERGAGDAPVPATEAAGAPSSAPQAAASTGDSPPRAPGGPAARPPRAVTIVAGGDVSFGRGLGQALLRDPEAHFFDAVAPLFATGDIRFVNLECPLSDQKGETQSPWVKLVFNGPPAGAKALSAAGIHIVSTANNHAWDYGKEALLETLDHLDRAGVAHAGTGRTREEAYSATVVERGGARVAFLAVTGMWNQGVLRRHPGAEHVADAAEEALVSGVRAARARPDVDFVVVSHHGGVEYLDLPIEKTRRLLRAAIDAGADAVLGHHPHVAQGIEWRSGRPILYSLGNLVMEMSEGRPKVSGYLARVRVSSERPPEVEACPLRFPSHVGEPIAGHPGREVLEKRFFGRLSRVSKPLGGIEVGEVGQDGCARVTAAHEQPAGPRGAVDRQ